MYWLSYISTSFAVHKPDFVLGLLAHKLRSVIDGTVPSVNTANDQDPDDDNNNNHKSLLTHYSAFIVVYISMNCCMFYFSLLSPCD